MHRFRSMLSELEGCGRSELVYKSPFMALLKKCWCSCWSRSDCGWQAGLALVVGLFIVTEAWPSGQPVVAASEGRDHVVAASPEQA